MALSITATVEAADEWTGGFGVQGFGNSAFGEARPPRVRLNITNTGSPLFNTVTVQRTDAAGRTLTVRTGDGGPLPLLASGTSRVGFLYDYEAPFGQQVTYSLVEQPTATAVATVGEDRPWLIHPGAPGHSMPVEFRKGSFEQEELAVTEGVFYPQGRRRAVVITDGQRKAGRGSFTVAIETAADMAKLLTLVDDASVLLLNVPPAMGLGVESDYVSVSAIPVRRPSDIGSSPLRDVAMPYTVADPPFGGQEPLWGWDEVARNYTWGQLSSLTWAQVLLGPGA